MCSALQINFQVEPLFAVRVRGMCSPTSFTLLMCHASKSAVRTLKESLMHLIFLLCLIKWGFMGALRACLN